MLKLSRWTTSDLCILVYTRLKLNLRDPGAFPCSTTIYRGYSWSLTQGKDLPSVSVFTQSGPMGTRELCLAMEVVRHRGHSSNVSVCLPSSCIHFAESLMLWRAAPWRCGAPRTHRAAFITPSHPLVSSMRSCGSLSLQV